MEANRRQAEKPPEHLPNVMGRDELNLAEFPLTALAHRVPDGCKQLVFQDRIRDQNTGQITTRTLTITGDAEYGLPTSLDDDVVVALIYMTKEANGFANRTVPFNRMAVVELLGWARNGQSLRRLDESLHRWLGVTLRYENAWWDKSSQLWVNESFHIIDNLTVYDQQTTRRIKKTSAQQFLATSSFSWNEVVFRSFQAQNLKRLDLTRYFHLTLAPSRRAYRFLDKRFYRSEILRFDLRDFACEHIGFSRQYSAAKIKEKLQPALDELESVGFLEQMSRDKRYEKIGRGEWKIVLIQGQEGESRTDPEASKPAERLEASGLVTELANRGVTRIKAAELVQQYPAGAIKAKLEIFDWLNAQNDKRVAKSPAGFLVKSITDDYAEPKGFISKAQRQRREEAQRAKEQQAAEKYRLQREQEARDQAERKAIAAYWESLTPDQQAKLQGDADAQADPETLALENGPFKRLSKQLRRDQHIRQLLRTTAGTVSC